MVMDSRGTVTLRTVSQVLGRANGVAYSRSAHLYRENLFLTLTITNRKERRRKRNIVSGMRDDES